jgi:exonuclease SbcC
LTPLKIVLKGFEGIHAAFARDSVELDLRKIAPEAQLVAIVGPNGSGKTTILDNLQPFRLMPSHTPTMTPGGFSYWDHVRPPYAEKKLIWSHEGETYKSVFAFRSTGKSRKADYYLFRQSDVDFEPMVQPDGIISDGRAETYDQCLESILGCAERFFTSQFSAQQRRILSDYSASDIKSILASVLNIQQYVELAGRAALVHKLLRQQQDAFQLDHADLQRELQAMTQTVADEAKLTNEVTAQNARLVELRNELVVQTSNLATLTERTALEASFVEERNFTLQQLEATSQAFVQERSSLTDRLHDARARNKKLTEERREEIVFLEQEVRRNRNQISEAKSAAERKGEVDTALQLKHDAEQELATLESAATGKRKKLELLVPTEKLFSELSASRAALEVKGLAQAEALQALQSTARLIDEVPCRGLPIKQNCKLLRNALEASAAIPGAQESLCFQRQNYQKLAVDVAMAQQGCKDADQIRQDLHQLQTKLTTLRNKHQVLSKTAAEASLVQRASEQLIAFEHQSEVLAERLIQAKQRDVAMAAAASAEEDELERALTQLDTRCETALAPIRSRLSSIPVPIGPEQLEIAKVGVQKLEQQLLAAQAIFDALSGQRIQLQERVAGQERLKGRVKEVERSLLRLADEMGLWKRIEKGLGNEGCVALCIDDAGPAITALCNQLLTDCFEGRFAVRIDTQSTNLRGTVKETFEVRVFDSRSSTEKSLKLMSGGEKVLLNECLTRAIALYGATVNAGRFETLFTDEADGALALESKRTFMQMKRSVLRQGQYAREYFITHTPELWSMADYIIDVTSL